MARSKSKQLDIFNFAFLDILACTVGALTFILVLLMVTTVHDATSDVDVQERLREIAALEEAIALADAKNEVLKDIAQSQSVVNGARLREQRAQEATNQARQQQELDGEKLAAAQSEIAEIDRRLRQLAPETEALFAEVKHLQKEVESRTTEIAQLERAELDRDKLIAQVRDLQKENSRLPDRIKELQAQADQQRSKADSLQQKARRAQQVRPKTLSIVSLLESDHNALREELEKAKTELHELQRTRQARVSSNRLWWAVVIVPMLGLLVVTAYLLWRLFKLSEQIRPLREWGRKLETVRTAHRELEVELKKLRARAGSLPESIDQAAEIERRNVQKAERRAAAARSRETEAHERIRGLEAQAEAEGDEARQLAAEAEREMQEARRRATPVRFRVPLLRPTSKESVVFDCYRTRVARVATETSLDEDYYGPDVAQTVMARSQLNEDVIILERKREGESISDLLYRESKLAWMVQQINPSRAFLYALVRPSGSEAFRRLREEAWKRDVEVGWQPMEEELPIVMGGSGRSPGVQ